MNLTEIFHKALGGIQNTFKQPELISPIPRGSIPQVQASDKFGQNFWEQADLRDANQALANVNPNVNKGQVLGANTNGGRNPNWEKWRQLAPKSFEQLLSGAQIASERTGVPAELLMDISGAETSGGQNLNQFGGAPGQGYFQFEPETLRSLGSNIDPYSATESAGLAADLIKKRQLSRWGTPQGNWGTLNNQKNKNGKLTELYTKAELNKYLSDKFQL